MVQSSSTGAEPPNVTSETCTSRERLGYAGRMTAIEHQPLTMPTLQALQIVLQVTALLVLGTWGVLYGIAAVLWMVNWR